MEGNVVFSYRVFFQRCLSWLNSFISSSGLQAFFCLTLIQFNSKDKRVSRHVLEPSFLIVSSFCSNMQGGNEKDSAWGRGRDPESSYAHLF